jgi:hypothetical protein
MSLNALVAVHGYSPDGMGGGKDPEIVWRDRLSKAVETVDKLEELDADIKVAISGAGDYHGKTEAEMIRDFAEEEFQELVNGYDVLMEDKSKNTEENVVKLHEIAVRHEVDALFVVSSKDHIPRVVRDWEEDLLTEEGILVAAIGSDKTYAASKKEPFILEAAMYEPFVEAFNEAWKVKPENYSEAAQEVREVLRKYQ